MWLAFGYKLLKDKPEEDSCIYKGKIGYINIFHERKQVTVDCE
jgi:hypothetical protein